MLKQCLFVVAALGLLVVTSEAQIIVQFEKSEIDKSDAKKADAKLEVRAYAIQIDGKDVPKATRWSELAIPFWVAGDTGSKYWVGVQCHPVSATLRAQLGLDKQSGLVVGHVVKDGPAAKAGIEQHDVLLAIGDKKLATQQQLAQQIQKHEGKSLKFKLLRAGKKKTIEVTPAERKGALAISGAFLPDADMKDVIIKWFGSHGPGRGPGGAPLKLRMLGPGVVFGGDFKFGVGSHDMPKDLHVSITHTNGKLAKITVKQGDKTWDLKEGELDKLPKELRPHVRRLMGGPHPPLDVKVFEGHKMVRPFGVDIRVEKVEPLRLRTKVLHRGTEVEGDVKKQIREMNKRLEKMQQDLRELLEKHGEK